jgi:hypothetical protein
MENISSNYSLGIAHIHAGTWVAVVAIVNLLAIFG